MSVKKEFTKGFWTENPVLAQLLGLCPTLAVTTNMKNGLGMGLASMFVLLGSNVVVSLVRNIIPARVRIPCYIVVIATFVTLVELLMEAYLPPLYDALGIYVPLIVVNCMILGRAEAFASNHTLGKSIVDALGIGAGFTVTLGALGAVREFLAEGTLYQIQVVPGWHSFMLLTFPPGAFLVLGFFLGIMNAVNRRRELRKKSTFIPPEHMNCTHCQVCSRIQEHETGARK